MMKKFGELNPFVTVIYILSVSLVAMFSHNFVFAAISLAGAVINSIAFGMKKLRFHLLMLLMLAVLALINPILSHNGATVLFVVNDMPITLEALVYGLSSSCGVVAVIYWFSVFGKIMTSDKLLYVLSPLSPKLSLTLSMALRYIPLYVDHWRKVKATQRAMGLYKDGNIIDRIIGGFRVFSVMLTWALEDGIITADSMAARGYGVGRRTHYSLFRIKTADLLAIVLTFALSFLTFFGMIKGSTGFEYYPEIVVAPPGASAILSYLSYAFLVLLPVFIGIEEIFRWRSKWRYSVSKI